MKNKRIIKLLLPIGLVIIIALGIVTMGYQKNLKAVSSQDESVEFSIVEGMSYQDVINELKQSGLIHSTFYTKLFLKLNSYPVIQVNTYQLNKNLDLKTIFNIISTGSYDYLAKDGMTITEGSTISEIASKVAEKLEISQEEVLNKWKDQDYLKTLINQYDFLDESILNDQLLYPLEGYLYPDTYSLVNVDKDIESYTALMLDHMQEVLDPYLQQIQDTGWSVHQFLTFTSIVERESLFEQDKAKIAGVFKNRLSMDMNLQSDITVLYALQRTGLDVSYSDLEYDSPYNTYKYKGLPVGPISSVYKTTIEACLNPEQSDYLYFFACKDGSVLYASTYEEHQKNVEENMWY